MTPSGIETVTYRFIASCLYHCTTVCPNICQIPPNNNTNMLTFKFNFNFLLFSILLTNNPVEKHFYTLCTIQWVKTASRRPLTSLVAGLPTWFPTALSTFRFRSGPLPGAFSFLTASFSPLSCILLIFLFLSSPAKKSDHASLYHVNVTLSESRFCDRSERISQETRELRCVASTSCKTKPGTCSFSPEYLKHLEINEELVNQMFSCSE